MLRDLGSIMPEPLPDQVRRLVAAWDEHWAGLRRTQRAVDAIDSAIDQTRDVVSTILLELR